jgi:DnaJ-class molecular chaperone
MSKSCIEQDMVDNALRALDLKENEIRGEKTITDSFTTLLEQLKGDKDGTERVINAKNTLIAAIIEDQLAEKSRYYIKIPIINPCLSCRGKGFRPDFHYDILVLPCKSCDGTGIARSKCKRCEGTGKAGTKTCRTCEGKGIYEYRKTLRRRNIIKCKSCMGSGNKARPVNTGKIKEVIKCKKCKGVGRKPSTATTPVLTEDIAKDIAKKITKT